MDTGQAEMGNQQGNRQGDKGTNKGTDRGDLVKWQGRPGKVTGEAIGFEQRGFDRDRGNWQRPHKTKD